MAQEETVMEMPFLIPKVFYMVLFAFGIGFYFIWGAIYGTWTDLAVYTVTVICVGLGLAGTLLYSIREEEESRA